MAFIQPLDLEHILVNQFAGGTVIFIFLAFLVIAILAARFKMPGATVVIVFSMFIVLISGSFYSGSIMQGFLLFIIFGVSWSIATSMSNKLG